MRRDRTSDKHADFVSESLEQRQLLSAGAASYGGVIRVDLLSVGTLTVSGDGSANKIDVAVAKTRNNQLKVIVTNNGDRRTRGEYVSTAEAPINSVVVDSGGGNDAASFTGITSLTTFKDLSLYAFLGDGNDKASVTNCECYVSLDGGRGNDVLTALDGVRKNAVTGPNTLFILYGNEGNDKLIGSRLGDILNGGPGDDILVGKDGDDVLTPGSGNDVVYGGAGSDHLTLLSQVGLDGSHTDTYNFGGTGYFDLGDDDDTVEYVVNFKDPASSVFNNVIIKNTESATVRDISGGIGG